MIAKLDISNVFGSLCGRLVLDVLSGKTSRDYACVIKVDEEFETIVYELRAYFGFSKLARTCEIQGDPLEFMFFYLVTLHLWGLIFKRFSDLRGLAYADDGNIIGRLSQVLRLVSELNPGFKLDGKGH